MGTVSTQLASRARTIFDELGYIVSGEGHELRAERKWRVVQVTPMPEPTEAPRSGTYRCFVTWDDHVGELRDRFRGQDLDYEWAIVGVRDDGDYAVREATTIGG